MAPKAAAAKAPPPRVPSAEPQGPDGDDAMDDDYGMPVIIKVKPEDQLQLSPEELDKEVPPRVLYPANPRAPSNLTQFSYKENVFKKDDQVDDGSFLVDKILDKTGMKGTGKWTVQQACDLSVAAPTMATSLDAQIGRAHV